MSPIAKYNTKWIIGITTGLLTIMSFTFVLGTGFAKNNSDHRAINTKIGTTDTIIAEGVKKTDSIVKDVSTIQTDIAVLKVQGEAVAKSLTDIQTKLSATPR